MNTEELKAKVNGEAGPEITPSTLYQVLCSLVNQSEQIRWTRLNNFLIANSIFVLAWAAVFVTDNIAFPIKQIALTWICVPGLVTAILWGPLGRRSSNYHDTFHELARSLESKLPDKSPKPFREVQPERDEAQKQCVTSSRFIVTYVPLGFGLFYAGLIALSWIAV